MSIKKSGMISIVGRPNVGKSTLTNALVGGEGGHRLQQAPDHPEPDLCHSEPGESQFVFLDTPGLHKARTRLGDYMVNVVKESVADVDAVMLLVEPIPNVGGPEAELIARIKTLGCPSVLVINKVDTLEHKEELLEVIQTYGQAHEFTAVVPVSARTGEGVEELLDVLDGVSAPGAPALPRGHGHRSAGAPDDGGDPAGEAAALPGQGDPPRHRRGDHQVFRAG